MVGLFAWLFRVSGLAGVPLMFTSTAATRHDESAPQPRREHDRGVASFSDRVLAALGEHAAWLCLALLMVARVTACHAWRHARPGLDPERSQDAPRGPPRSR